VSEATRQVVLLIDDDDQILEGLASLLERDGRTTIVCSDLQSAELALTHCDVTHIVTDVQFSGDFSYEGLHSLSRIRALRPRTPVFVMTGQATDSLRAAAIAQGATAILAKPFSIDALESTIGLPSGHGPYEILRVPSIEEVLRGGVLQTAFQPIVRLADPYPSFAFEALSRMEGPWALGGPSELFAYADRRDRLVDLNLTAMDCALRASAELPEAASLFLNLDPEVLALPRAAAVIERKAREASVPLGRLVIEITERSALTRCEATTASFARLRSLGVRFALDDHGSAYSHLESLDVIRPSFIKISQSFGTGFEQDATRHRIVRNVVSLARDFDAAVILEGIETRETALAAEGAGIQLGQGYLFGRPAVAARWAGSVACAA
jgi:EAL domain-containing protein (putative c-di-GMP-specific phosphodiesterase class I)/ActR/RegA family two-component response regulator